MSIKYNPQKIERKWQRYWEAKKIYNTKDLVKGRKNYMLLAEFPYTSGNLHIGHWFTYAISDILARYLRMKGCNVMFPIGFDAFGLPAENAALKRHTNPATWTKQNIQYMTKQLKSIGTTFDWQRVVDTSSPEYYKWTQWIFLKLYEKGLAYRAQTPVNWCPKDKTVLANEQVVDGKCDRCDTTVEQKELAQWMFKTTDFADQLIDDLEELDWQETAKKGQGNWIGRSEGTIAEFKLDNLDDSIEIFTTRIDTIFGATYVVLAPEHPLIEKLKSHILNTADVDGYVEQSKRKTELQRISEVKNKTGVPLTGITAVNPMSDEKIPVWIADYVLAHYGTGAVMAVPAHDERDFEFAKKFGLKSVPVVLPTYIGGGTKGWMSQNNIKDEKSILAHIKEDVETRKSTYVHRGNLINSSKFDGLTSDEAKQGITEELISKKLGNYQKTYRLHDWVLSRQRYWGTPIPMIRCNACGYQPVPEKNLPVKLPSLKDFKPANDGRSPLAKAGKWLKVRCPKCKEWAERETDTMDTFVDSSWYFMRYTDSKNKNMFAEKEKIQKWLPVPMYIGGREHITMHLLYARFITKALNSLGIVHFSEPFLSRRNHGVIMGPDGKKMSKSRGNVVNPDVEVAKFGSDTMRINFAFLGPFDQDYSWNQNSINGVSRFLNRAWNFVNRFDPKYKGEDKEVKRVLNKAIKKVQDATSQGSFNTGVSELMKTLNAAENKHLNKKQYEILLKIFAPYAPHLAEELWINVLKNKKSIHLESWPEYDVKLLEEEKIKLVVQVNGKVRDMIEVQKRLEENEAKFMTLASEKVRKFVNEKNIKRVIYIKDRIINFVTNSVDI